MFLFNLAGPGVPVSNNPSKIRLATPLSPKKSLMPQTSTSMSSISTKPMFSGSAQYRKMPQFAPKMPHYGTNSLTTRQPSPNPQIPTQPKKTQKEAEQHGLICKNGCTCAIMNGSTIFDDKKLQIFAHLKRCLKIVGSKVSTTTHY